MSDTQIKTETTETISTKMDRLDRYQRDYRRRKRIQNIKTGGSLMMYIGSAGLMMPMIQKARERQNGVMGLCAAGAGVILSVGLGNVASRIFGKTVDRVVDFWDDVKPSGPAKKPAKEPDQSEEPENG